MKHFLKRLVTMTLALAMVLSVLGTGTVFAAAAYGKTTADEVFLRKNASTGADYWFRLSANTVCEVLDVEVKGNVTWYRVDSAHPDPASTRRYIGYIHGDYFRPLTDEEVSIWQAEGQLSTATAAPTTAPTQAPADPAPTQAPTQAPSSSGNTNAYVGATGQITNDGVNFRETPGGQQICKLNRGTVVEILTIPSVVDDNHWYRIRYDGVEGYVMSTFLMVISTGDPNAAPVDPDMDISTLGYVKLVLSSANLRLSPGGDVGAQWENTGEVLEIMEKPIEHNNFIWYAVDYEGHRYYVREDTVQLQATPGSSVVGGQATAAPVNVVGYVRTTARGVNLRLKPAGKVIQQIDKGLILPYIAEPTLKDGYNWYFVQMAGNVRGYLRGDCVVVCNADGSDYTGQPTDPPSATQAPSTAYGYVRTVKDKVNLRTKPTGTSQEQIALGVVLPMTGPVEYGSGRYDWYPVKAASGKTGVVRSDCVVPCNADGSDLGTQPSVPTTAPTQAPTQAPTLSQHGYVMMTKPGVNLRKTAGGAKIDTLDQDTVWPLTGDKVKSGSYYWYPVNVNGKAGYVRNDCCFKLSKTQEASYLAGKGVPEEDVSTQSNYVITTLDKVNLRAGATKESEARFNVPLGTVMAYKAAPIGGSNWYKVIYNNAEVWVLGSCVAEMTTAEYEAWAAQNPNNTPQTDVIAGYVKTTDGGVNLRKTAGGAVIGRLDKGTVCSYARTTTANNKTWYYVKTDLGYGYLHGDYVVECNKDGSSFTPSVTNQPGTTGQEASYTTLRKGSTGTAVKNLVQELKNQGYYTGTVTNQFTTEVENAVKKFQAANNLEVDGVAGSKTQHKLFGTVPIGSGDSSNLSMTLYPAEKIDWFTGGIQQLWPKGANYKIYDVKTGIVWWAHRWSGGFHADIEPLTAADTARLCKIYGVNNAQEIADKNMWERRPCLVTIGTRTFACSLDGMPHNPAGDTIDNNNMTGQICLHFTNSKGHESGAVSSTHQEAIEYAYKNAPNGQKK